MSYVENNQVCRVADFERGRAEVTLLLVLGAGDTADDVEQRIHAVVHQWLNSTEADAYQADQLSQRIEQRLQDHSSVVKTAQPGQQRICSGSHGNPYCATSWHPMHFHAGAWERETRVLFRGGA